MLYNLLKKPKTSDRALSLCDELKISFFSMRMNRARFTHSGAEVTRCSTSSAAPATVHANYLLTSAAIARNMAPLSPDLVEISSSKHKLSRKA